MSMFDNEYDPFERLSILERESRRLSETLEDLNGQQVNTAWLLEQVSKHMVDVSTAINTLFENQRELQREIKLIRKNNE